MIDDQILLRAKKEALKSNQRTHKMSAMVLSDKKAYSMLRSYNQNIFDARMNNGKRSIHAEENLIAKAAKRGMKLHGVTVLVYRYKRSVDGPGTSEPCPKCRIMLTKAGVRKIVFYSGSDWVIKRI